MALVGGALLLVAPAASRTAAGEGRCSGELVSPTFGFAVCGQRVFVTRNARSWRDVTPPRLGWPIDHVAFIDSLRGWIVTNDCTAGRASVHRTRDGGRTWSWTPVRSTNCAAGSRHELSFLDGAHGWLVRIEENGNQTELDRTVDGGRRWAPALRVPLKGPLIFRTTRNGWAGRADFRGWGLWMTVDGGRRWRRQPLPAPAGWRGAALFPDLPRFFGKQRERGVLVVDLVRRKHRGVAFYVTSDGGRHWAVRAIRRVEFPIVKRLNPFVHYVPSSVATPSAWWLFITPRTIAVTTDAGRRWRVSRVPATGELSAIDGRHAWLSAGGLSATSDGGQTWQKLAPP